MPTGVTTDARNVETALYGLQQWEDREWRRPGGNPRAVIRVNRRDPGSLGRRLGGLRRTNLELTRQLSDRLVPQLADRTVLVRAVLRVENDRSRCHRDQGNRESANPDPEHQRFQCSKILDSWARSHRRCFCKMNASPTATLIRRVQPTSPIFSDANFASASRVFYCRLTKASRRIVESTRVPPRRKCQPVGASRSRAVCPGAARLLHRR